MPKFKFESGKLQDILKEYATLREVEIPKAVLINGRLLAKELARRTQPFGTKNEAGKQRVENDIGKVIKDDAHLSKMIDHVNSDSIKQKLRSLLTRKNYRGIKEIFQNIGFLNKYDDMEIVSSFRTHHQSARNARTGRTKSPGTLIIANGNLESYIAETASRVGISKAGWAVAADALPPTVANRRSSYDFPTWVKANMEKASGSAEDNTGNIAAPSVKLTNSTPWIDRICPISEQMGAISVVVTRMKKQMQQILKARKKAEEAAD